MKIILQKKAKVEKYQILMSIDIEEDHPEIVVWLQLVNEAIESNENIIDYFQKKIFSDSKKPKQFIQNIIDELVINGLLDSTQKLTEKGINAIETGIVFLPQQGIYEISVINDPLFPQVILDFSELKPNLHAELNVRNDETQEEDLIRNVEIPHFILVSQNRGTINTISKSRSRNIVVSNIDKKGNQEKATSDTSFKMEIDDELNISLKIYYRNNYHSLEIPDFNKNKMVEDLLTKISLFADLSLYRIPISYNKTSFSERVTFSKNFDLMKVKTSSFGVFDSVTIEDLSIYPEDFNSAVKWSRDLILGEISSYLTEEGLITIEEKINKNLGFKDYQLPITSREDFLEIIPFGSDKYWFLKAPEDLKLEKVIK